MITQLIFVEEDRS